MYVSLPCVVAGTVLIMDPAAGRYFSFPSFDLYEGSQQDDEKSETKSP
jgi:hypothetical protein